MVRWDVERSPMSVQLLVGLGADHGLPRKHPWSRPGWPKRA